MKKKYILWVDYPFNMIPITKWIQCTEGGTEALLKWHLDVFTQTV